MHLDEPFGRVGLVFLHDRADPITLNNLESFRRWNPGVPIVTVSSGEPIEDGFSLQQYPEDAEIWERHTKVEWRRARSSDILLFLWYRRRNLDCDFWIIVEWDAYCAMSVSDFLEPVAGFNVVAPSIRLLNREPEWSWFRQATTLPAEFHRYAMGIVPFCFITVADFVLAKMCARMPWQQLGEGNGELRFATLAHACGYPPVAHPLAGANISWQPLPPHVSLSAGMWHPVKFLPGTEIDPDDRDERSRT